MTGILYLIIGLAIGGAAAWLVVSYRLRAEHTSEITRIQQENAFRLAEIEGRSKAAEAVVQELRSQVQQREEAAAKLLSDSSAERQAKVEALTRLDAAQKGFDEQKALLEAMKKEMTDTFNALSSAALKSSSEDFLRLASESLGRVVSDTKGKLGEHQVAMDGMIKPLADALKRYEEQIRIMEDGRHKAYGSLEEQLRALASTHENLQKETSNLVSALRRPEVRGRWGEMQLRRVAELAGMSEHCDFEEQVSVDTEKGRLRPDMTVKLPGERRIVVDSKVSLSAYLEAVAAGTDDERKALLLKHGQQVRTHMMKLSSKEYWNQFDQSPEFVILFIPGESFLGAALDSDPTLIEDGIEKRVIISTPTTFIALLRAIAYGWRQEQVTKNAQQIGVLGKELYERMSTLAKHFGELGTAIERSISSYNKIVGSMESRVLPSVRKFRELGVSGAEEVPVIQQIDQKPRNLSLLDFE
ncbi:MAG: DNA recombination protein RmuC [Nitrospiraceae bacterium]|nr:DNA recombination protein RmuC [Nitrospiraceae bacterium]